MAERGRKGQGGRVSERGAVRCGVCGGEKGRGRGMQRLQKCTTQE